MRASMRIDCDRARLGFPDLMDGPADADLVDHLRGCSGCARELRSFKAVVEAASLLGGYGGYGGHDVPDPGEAYWEQFLPSVKARIESGRAGGGTGREAWLPLFARPSRAVRAAAAAVVLMMAAGMAAFMLTDPVPPDAGSIEMAGLRLQMALDHAAVLPVDSAGAIALPGDELPAVGSPRSLTENLPEIDPADLIQALEEIYRPAGDGYLWVEDDVAGLLQGLSAPQAARLRAQLAAEQC